MVYLWDGLKGQLITVTLNLRNASPPPKWSTFVQCFYHCILNGRDAVFFRLPRVGFRKHTWTFEHVPLTRGYQTELRTRILQNFCLLYLSSTNKVNRCLARYSPRATTTNRPTQKSNFCIVIAIFVNGANDHYTRSYNFPIGTTPKKNSASELGVIFWGSPLFLAILGLCHDRGIPTLNFGPTSTKLEGTVRVIKKWPRRTLHPVRAGITEKRALLRSAEKWFLA